MESGVEVTYDIDFDYGGEALLYGDLHIHTTASVITFFLKFPKDEKENG